MTGRLPARDLALIATFAALIAVLGLPGQLNLFGNAVPVTAQTLGVMLAGSLLGAWRGALAVLTFCVLVLLGLPLLAGGRGGLGVLTSPSAGYFLGFTAGAFVVGALMGLWRGRFALGWALVANVVGGILVIYAIGIPLQAWITGLPLTAVVVKSAVFLPGDLIKAVVAAVVARGVVRAYPRAELAAPRERARAS
jgi:biotin transport system substrate-specific component